MIEISDSPVELSIDALICYLKGQLGEISQFLNEFPTGNIKLQYPTVAVTHSAEPTFTNEMPYELQLTGKDGQVQTDVVWITGQWDYKLQLDIWARSVPERNRLFQRLFNALNAQIEPMGLSLQIPNYFGLWGRFEIDSFSHMDGEQPAQRGEWRTKVSVLASVKQAQAQQARKITKPIVTDIEILNTSQDAGT